MNCSRVAVSACLPCPAAVYSVTLAAVIPANGSSPSASCGAGEARQATARQRSGSSAAQARGLGPPPDQPIVTNSPRPRWLRMASVAAAASARTAVVPDSGLGVDNPNQGLE